MNVFQFLRTSVVLLVAVAGVSFTSGTSGAERAYRTRNTAMLDLGTGDFVAAGNGTLSKLGRGPVGMFSNARPIRSTTSSWT